MHYQITLTSDHVVEYGLVPFSDLRLTFSDLRLADEKKERRNTGKI